MCKGESRQPIWNIICYDTLSYENRITISNRTNTVIFYSSSSSKFKKKKNRTKQKQYKNKRIVDEIKMLRNLIEIRQCYTILLSSTQKDKFYYKLKRITGLTHENSFFTFYSIN